MNYLYNNFSFISFVLLTSILAFIFVYGYISIRIKKKEAFFKERIKELQDIVIMYDLRIRLLNICLQDNKILPFKDTMKSTFTTEEINKLENNNPSGLPIKKIENT